MQEPPGINHYSHLSCWLKSWFVHALVHDAPVTQSARCHCHWWGSNQHAGMELSWEKSNLTEGHPIIPGGPGGFGNNIRWMERLVLGLFLAQDQPPLRRYWDNSPFGEKNQGLSGFHFFYKIKGFTLFIPTSLLPSRSWISHFVASPVLAIIQPCMGVSTTGGRPHHFNKQPSGATAPVLPVFWFLVASPAHRHLVASKYQVP